jgi:hypothetical protein
MPVAAFGGPEGRLRSTLSLPKSSFGAAARRVGCPVFFLNDHGATRRKTTDFLAEKGPTLPVIRDIYAWSGYIEVLSPMARIWEKSKAGSNNQSYLN